MGFFSWKFADVKQRLKIGREAYVPVAPCFHDTYGVQIHTHYYDGYGHFGKYDIYDLVADWNRKYLAENPSHYLPGQEEKVSAASWYKYYADLSLSKKEIEELMSKEEGYKWEYRYIGIHIACYNEDNASLEYPIKICKYAKNAVYDDLPASDRDPMQGCD